MILEKKVHACSKRHSKAVIKNGENACGNQQYHYRICGAYGIFEPHDRHMEEEKEHITKAYQERSSMCGIERSHGILSSIFLSAKKQ